MSLRFREITATGLKKSGQIWLGGGVLCVGSKESNHSLKKREHPLIEKEGSDLSEQAIQHIEKRKRFIP